MSWNEWFNKLSLDSPPRRPWTPSTIFPDSPTGAAQQAIQRWVCAVGSMRYSCMRMGNGLLHEFCDLCKQFSALVNEPRKKSGLGLRGPGAMFNDNLKNGKCHKLITYILINSSLVIWTCHLQKIRILLFCVIYKLAKCSTNVLTFRALLLVRQESNNHSIISSMNYTRFARTQNEHPKFLTTRNN